MVSTARRDLAIYTLGECWGCERARDIAAAVAGARTDVNVRLIDLGVERGERPAAVIAVPTYLLDGQVISLGNPDLSWLLSRLSEKAEDVRELGGDPG